MLESIYSFCHTMSMKIICIGQEKGGVGKSTLTGNLAVALAHQNQRVIIIDSDRQQTCMKWGSRRQLAGVEPKIDFASLLANPSDLGSYIKTIRGVGESGRYDACLIDVGGRDTPELRGAMGLAHVLVAPCLPSQPDIESLAEFETKVSEALAFNPDLRHVVVFNRAPAGLFAGEAQAAVQAFGEMTIFGPPVASITDRPTYRDSWARGQGVYDLEPKTGSAAAKSQAELSGLLEAL